MACNSFTFGEQGMGSTLDFYKWFLVCSQKYRKMIKFCTSYMVYSQIWLNLPMDDRHFGLKTEFP
jgi:hypothetical protein